jgi:hypothetical protein
MRSVGHGTSAPDEGRSPALERRRRFRATGPLTGGVALAFLLACSGGGGSGGGGGGKSGSVGADLQFELTWSADADLDTVVTTPAGHAVGLANASSDGCEFGGDDRGAPGGGSERVDCTAPPIGPYLVSVGNPGNASVTGTLRVVEDGVEQLRSDLLIPGGGQAFEVYESELQPPGCDVISVGRRPLDDLGTGEYLGFEGGLYPAGQNDPPPGHMAEALARAQAIQPLDAAGQPSPTGAIVLLSIGMSNTTQEYSTFVDLAEVDPGVDKTWLILADGAKGSEPADTWTDPSFPNYDRVRDLILANRHQATEQQVQAVWLKQAHSNPRMRLPDPGADAYELLRNLADIVRAIRVRYPNVQVVFLSSRIYAGYATTLLNPEPYAYESGLTVKWLIEAQIDQMNGLGIDPIAGNLDWNSTAPLLVWGPYLWADGLTPRSDGLIWECPDFDPDGTHPSEAIGWGKVGQILLDFFLTSPLSTPWFRA